MFYSELLLLDAAVVRLQPNTSRMFQKCLKRCCLQSCLFPPVISARPNKAGLFNTCSTWWVRVQSVWKRSNAENPAWCMCARFFCFPFVYGRHEIFLERNSTAVKSHTHAHKREAHVHTTKDEKCSCSWDSAGFLWTCPFTFRRQKSRC